MKKILLTSTCFFGIGLCLGSSGTWQWTGGEGDVDVSLGSNWDKGSAPSRANGQGPEIIFDNVGSITDTSHSFVDTSDGGSVTVRNNSFVTLKLGRWGGNLYIEEGSTLVNSGVATNLKDGIYNIFGAYHQTWDIKFDAGGGPQRFNLGSNGLVKTNSQIYYNSGLSYSITADVVANTASSTGLFSLEKRILISAGNQFNGWDNYTWNIDNNITDSATGNNLIWDDSLANLTDGSDLSSYQGKYHIGLDEAKQNLVLTYVKTDPIPEPSVAMLGLLGLGGIALRRRRK